MEECAYCYDPIKTNVYYVAGMTFHQECKEYLKQNPDCWPQSQTEVEECRPK
jgi:hypothetical protein